MKYRKKPVVIDAIQWDGTRESFVIIKERMGAEKEMYLSPKITGLFLVIDTLEGEVNAKPFDWIIKRY